MKRNEGTSSAGLADRPARLASYDARWTRDLDWWHGWHLRVVPRGARGTSPGRHRAQPRAGSRVVVWRAVRGLARPAAAAAYALRGTVAGSTRPVRADDPLGRPPSGCPGHHQLVAHVDDTGRVPGVVTGYPLGDR
jgi:hypothetical protein